MNVPVVAEPAVQVLERQPVQRALAFPLRRLNIALRQPTFRATSGTTPNTVRRCSSM